MFVFDVLTEGAFGTIGFAAIFNWTEIVTIYFCGSTAMAFSSVDEFGRRSGIVAFVLRHRIKLRKLLCQ